MRGNTQDLRDGAPRPGVHGTGSAAPQWSRQNPQSLPLEQAEALRQAALRLGYRSLLRSFQLASALEDNDNNLFNLRLSPGGLAFNTTDRSAGGVWRLKADTVVIEWASGWRAEFEPRVQGPLRARIWESGADPQSPPSAVRSGERIE